MSNIDILVEGHIAERDYVRAQWLNIRPRPFHAALGGGLLILMVAVSAIHIVGYMRSTGSSSDATIGPFLLILAAVMFLIVLPWQFKRSYRKYPAIQEPLHMTWSGKGLSVDSEMARVDVPWRMFIKYRENRHLFLVYQSPQLFQMIPKRLLRDDDCEALKVLLQRNVGKAS